MSKRKTWGEVRRDIKNKVNRRKRWRESRSVKRGKHNSRNKRA